MAFTGKEGGPVNLETLQKAVERYKEKNPKSASSHFFGKDCISQLLDQPGSVGIRVLHGVDENGDAGRGRGWRDRQGDTGQGG